MYNTFYPTHDDVIKWKHFSRYWPFVQGIHRSQVNSPQKSQWRGALMFSLICVWVNGWGNNPEAGDLRCNCTHHDVIVMIMHLSAFCSDLTELIHSLRWRHNDHAGVSNHQPHGSSIWHSSNTGSPSQQSEQTSILLGSGHFVWASFLFWIHRIWWGCG